MSLTGTAGAEELLLVESDRVRIAVKPNLQAEEGLAGEHQLLHASIQGWIFIHLLTATLSWSFSSPFHHLYIEGGFSGEAGDV